MSTGDMDRHRMIGFALLAIGIVGIALGVRGVMRTSGEIHDLTEQAARACGHDAPPVINVVESESDGI